MVHRATLPMLVMGVVLASMIALVGLSTAFLLDTRSPLAIDKGNTLTLSLDPPTDERGFEVIGEAARDADVTVLKWAPELSSEDGDVLVDVVNSWQGPAEIVVLAGDPAVIVDSAHLEHLIFDGDYLLVGDERNVDQWHEEVTAAGIIAQPPISGNWFTIVMEIYLYFPMVVLLAGTVVLLAVLAPAIWAGLNSRALALLVINGASWIQRLRFIGVSIFLPILAAFAAVTGVVLAGLVMFGRAQLVWPVLGIIGGYSVLAGVLLGLSLLLVLALSPRAARVFGERRNSIRAQLRLLGGAGVLVVVMVALSVAPFTESMNRSDEAEARVQALEGLPDSAVNLGLYGLPGDPVGPDPVHDAFLAAPLRELSESGAVSLANIWLTDFGPDRRTPLIVADQAYLDFVGESSLQGPLSSEHPYAQEWRQASTYLGRTESDQHAVAHDSRIYEVAEDSVLAAPRSQVFEYVAEGAVVAVLPSVDLLTDASLVSFGSNGSLLVDDLELAQAAFYKHRATNHWYPFFISDGGEAAREYRFFNRAASIVSAAAAVLALTGIVLMMTWLRARIRREEYKLLILDGRSPFFLVGGACARDLVAVGLLTAVGIAITTVAHPASLPAVFLLSAGLAILVPASWFIMFAVLRRKIGAR